MKHTPGPWKIDPESPLAVIQDAPDGYGIAEIVRIPGQAANARLIAESPNLLFALQGARDRLQFALEHVENYEQRLNIEAEIRIADGAIAKAEPSQEYDDDMLTRGEEVEP